MSETSNQARIGASDVTVVIPAFNEGTHIGNVVRELIAEVPGVHVLVVDDGSSDNTREAARSAGADVIGHRRNTGYGASLRTGIFAAKTSHVATYDADGQHRPEDLRKMIACAGEFDIVIGARGKDSHREMSRRPGKWVLSVVANLLAGQRIPDLNCGLRVMNRGIILRYVHLWPRGFSASTTTTICMLQRGYDVEFMPITTRKREGGKSMVKKVGDGLRTIQLIVRLIILFNPQRFFLPPALFLTLAGLIYGVVRALIGHAGIPTLAVMVVVTGLITGMFGLLAEQISALRLELFEQDNPGRGRP